MPDNSGKQAYWLLAAGAILFLAALLVTPVDRLTYRDTSERRIVSGTTAHTPPEAGFRDRTWLAGLFAYHLQGGETLAGLDESLGAGACVLDFDNDHDVDLFVIGGSGQSRYYGRPEWWQQTRGNVLYRNNGSGAFEDVTRAAGLDEPMWGMGCIAGDLDNDGDTDLLITGKGANRLYRNNADGTFADVSDASGLSGMEWSTSATLADYDADGLLDIYIVNYIDYDRHLLTYEGGSGYLATLSPRFDATLYNSQPNRLYHNTGNLVFEDVTETTGVADASGRGLAARWLDLNDDGYPDLVISNDGGFPNAVYFNRRNGLFDDRASPSRLNTSRPTRGIAAGDIDRDGDTDLLFGTDQGALPLLYANSDTPWPVKSREALERGQFLDLTRETGLVQERSATLSGWGTGLADFNNDGLLDAILTHGLLTADPDNPAIPQGQPKQILLNRGNGRFSQLHGAPGSGLTDRLSGRALVLADFDNNGTIDVYATHNHFTGQLLLNTTNPGNWVGLVLEPASGNNDAIGAGIRLDTAGGTQYAAATDGAGFLSGSDRRLHFGLGDNTVIEGITVHWTDHSETRIDRLAANRYYRVSQATGMAEPVATDTTPEPESPLGILLEHETSGMHLMSWLGDPATFPLLEPVIRRALESTDVDTRHTALEWLRPYRSPRALALLLDALEDDDEAIRLAAVDMAGHYEESYAITHLLRLFSRTDSATRCAAADMFAFYFREEEAVTRHKYLAVPWLIRMLEDNEPATRICAANALAESEQYRAVAPLLERLDDPEREVRMAAVRALGMIRETSPQPALRSMLLDPEQPPAVLAQNLIALKRLGMTDSAIFTRALLPPPANGQAIERAKRTLQALILLTGTLSEGVVFKPDLIAQQALSWLEASQNAFAGDSMEEMEHLDSLLATCLEVLVNTAWKPADTQARHFTTHANGMIRSRAWGVLLATQGNDPGPLTEQALADPDPQVRRWLLETMERLRITPTARQLEPLLNNAVTRDQATRLLARLHNPAAGVLKTRLLNDAAASKTQKLAILATAGNLAAAAPDLPPDLMNNPDPDVRLAALSAWEELHRKSLQTTPPDIIAAGLRDPVAEVRARAARITGSRREAWALHNTEQLLLSAQTERGMRLALLDAITESGNKPAAKLIRKLSGLRHDPVSNDALAYLGKIRLPDTSEIVRQAAVDASGNMHRRLAGISALYHRQPQAAIEALQAIDRERTWQ